MINDKLARLNSYFNTIFSTDEDLSIRKISKATFLPLNVVRQDLLSLTSMDCAPFFFDDEEDDITDDTPLYGDDLVKERAYQINLSPEEYSYVSNLISEGSSKDKSVPFLIKNNYKYYSNSEKLNNILSVFCNAINLKKQVFFSCKNKNDVISDYIATPVRIIYDNDDNRYSLLCYSNKNYIVFDPEKIEKSFTPDDALNSGSYGSYEYMHIIKHNNEIFDEGELQRRIPHVWKNDFMSRKPIHAKIRFKDAVFNEVKKEIFYHNPDVILSKPQGGYFFLEDDIYGIDAFFSWIRGYGSNAIIFEPKSLRLRHIDSLKESLKKYE